MTDLSPSLGGRSALEVATEVVKQAGEVLLAHFYGEKEMRNKGQGELVTEADILSQRVIVKLLADEYPDYNFLAEESMSSAKVTGYTWLVDPLAGTNNYVFGIPFFGINIALVRDNDILMSITYDPLRDELFRAEKGKGAYLNNSPIHVSERVSLQDSLLGFDPGYDRTSGGELLKAVTGLWPEVFGLRVMGSASMALAYVASGRIDLYVRYGVQPWDIASGLLLVREAGGRVSDWQGEPANFWHTEIVAANGTLQREFLGHWKPA
ncbi:MAG: inositol monophosphatase family protein [Dehalococcoidales bacterium]|jgi:myo-inositol-1(or 4)-monophosphatase|nr:inositol monophosphatase family protein [Dehalococcoidales bacterium]MDP7286298.1 inositol monophosphatase family protein [Dehalococcoidales bacterium]